MKKNTCIWIHIDLDLSIIAFVKSVKAMKKKHDVNCIDGCVLAPGKSMVRQQLTNCEEVLEDVLEGIRQIQGCDNSLQNSEDASEG